MRILLSNDDGYRAPGLLALARKLRTLADVLVVAPERNRSGASSSLTLDRPLRLTQIETDSYAVDGTPADYTLAAAITYDLVRRWQAAVAPKCWLLNVNVPGAASPKGLVATRLGRRQRGDVSIAAQDPYGRPIFWVGPVGPPGLDAGPGTDFHAAANHYVSVTPLQRDMTAYSEIETVTSLVAAP